MIFDHGTKLNVAKGELNLIGSATGTECEWYEFTFCEWWNNRQGKR